MRQAVATGNPRGLVAHASNAPVTFHNMAQAQFEMVANSPMLQQEIAWGVVNSPYHDYRYEAIIPLAQLVSESQKTAMAAQEQLKADTETLETANRKTLERNGEAVSVLNTATGQNLPADRTTWTRWWVDQIGYAFAITQTTDKPTVIEDVPLSYQPQVTPVAQSFQGIGYRRMSCFGAGTPVQTVDGLRPIESLKVGDLVLSQSIDTGALAYKPILVVHHNPPSPTFRIKVEGEAIISSYFHRFWVAGRGWVMARDLKAGDAVRTLGGVVKVDSVEDDKTQLVYNLDVAEAADFFVGKLGALVHDNTLPDPRLVPFDGPAKGLAVKAGD
jgi:hypothetical protein